jgi:hypothetical protein
MSAQLEFPSVDELRADRAKRLADLRTLALNRAKEMLDVDEDHNGPGVTFADVRLSLENLGKLREDDWTDRELSFGAAVMREAIQARNGGGCLAGHAPSKHPKAKQRLVAVFRRSRRVETPVQNRVNTAG